MKKIFIIVYFSCQFSVNICSQWVQTNGPVGGIVSSLAVKDSLVFMGTQANGVHVSTDHGQSWAETSLNNHSVIRLAVNGTKLFAGTFDSGIYASTNNGQTWTQTALTTPSVHSIIVNGSNMFAASAIYVYLSTDNGQNWTQTPLNNQTNVYALTAYGTNIFAGTDINGVFLSTNNGQNWSQTSFNNQTINCLLTVGSYVFAGTDSGIYKTTDNGVSWTQTSMNNQYVGFMTSIGSTIYAGTTPNGLWLSTDNGQIWKQTSLNDQPVNSFVISAGNFVAGTGANGPYLSTDYGQTWAHTILYNQIVESLTANDSNIYAGAWGVHITTNNGQNWTQTSFNSLYITAIAVRDSTIFAGTGAHLGVFRSTDNGEHWIQTSLGNYAIFSLLIKGIYIFAGAVDPSGIMGYIFVSTDNGDTWNISLYGVGPNALATNGTDIFAGEGEVWLTTNDGQNWINTLHLLTNYVISLAANGPYVWAGRKITGGILRSTNYGYNWEPTSLNNQYVHSLAVTGTNVFAGTDWYGVFVSSDNGETWVQRNEGLGNLDIHSLTISNGYVFAGTWGGSVWKRPLSEMIGINEINSKVPDRFYLYQNYPNPFNPKTRIKYEVAKYSHVKISMFDILGRETAVLVNEQLSPGTYEAEFDASNYPSGVFFYRLTVINASSPMANPLSITKKMVLIK